MVHFAVKHTDLGPKNRGAPPRGAHWGAFQVHPEQRVSFADHEPCGLLR